MRDVCFIADAAVLPRWLRVRQALDYVAGVHPRFERARSDHAPGSRACTSRHSYGQCGRSNQAIGADASGAGTMLRSRSTCAHL
jgi:hypothetical protein